MVFFVLFVKHYKGDFHFRNVTNITGLLTRVHERKRWPGAGMWLSGQTACLAHHGAPSLAQQKLGVVSQACNPQAQVGRNRVQA